MDGLIPCTPAGILDLLATIDVDLTGADVAVLGRSRIVGMPMALLLAARGSDATVTVLHSKSGDIIERCRASDVVIAAIGKAEMVRPEWIKPGAVVIDVGITRSLWPMASAPAWLAMFIRMSSRWHPPHAGAQGVGPMTIASDGQHRSRRRATAGEGENLHPGTPPHSEQDDDAPSDHLAPSPSVDVHFDDPHPRQRLPRAVAWTSRSEV